MLLNSASALSTHLQPAESLNKNYNIPSTDSSLTCPFVVVASNCGRGTILP
jgi:hypothetical protein